MRRPGWLAYMGYIDYLNFVAIVLLEGFTIPCCLATIPAQS